MDSFEIIRYDRYKKYLEFGNLLDVNFMNTEGINGIYFKDFTITLSDKNLRNIFVIK